MKTTTTTRYELGIILFILLSFVQIAMLLALSIEMVAVERFCSYAIMILGMGVFAYSYISDARLRQGDMYLLLMACIFIVVGVYEEWPYRGIVNMCCFVLMISVWRSAGMVENSRLVVKVLYRTFAAQAAVLIGLFFSPLAHKGFTDYEAVSRELTLGFDNPNQTGIIIFSTLAILLLLQQKKLENRYWNALILFEVVFLSVELILTRARVSILGYMVFLFFFVFTTKRSVRNKHFVLADGLLWVPLVFVFAYLWVYNSRFQAVHFMGKLLFSGRERVYASALRAWNDKVFGNLERFVFSNSHNSHLTILVNVGIVGFLLYMLYTTNAFNRFYAKCETRQQILCTVAILSLFVMGCGETAVLTGGTIYYVYMLTFLVLGGNERANDGGGGIR